MGDTSQEEINIDNARILGSLEQGFEDLRTSFGKVSASLDEMRQAHSEQFAVMRRDNDQQHGELGKRYEDISRDVRIIRRKLRKIDMVIEKFENDITAINARLEASNGNRWMTRGLVGMVIFLGSLYADMQTGANVHKYAGKAVLSIIGK